MNHSSRRSVFSSVLATVIALASCAVPRQAASQPLRAEVGAYALAVLVDGAPVRTFVHGGETHVLGQAGSRYALRVYNRTARRIEAVVSVDGLDVIDGQPADVEKRGYLVPAHGHVDIEGFRVSGDEVAAFRFAAVADSYAAKSGHARHVGVLGVAVFPERVERRRTPVAAPPPRPFPATSSEARSSAGGAPPSAPTSVQSAPAPRASATSGAPTFEAESARDEAPAGAGSDAASSASAAPRRERSGLGTEFGEPVASAIRHVAFQRERARTPAALLGARYDDRAGLVALGIDVDGSDDLALRQTARPFPRSTRVYAVPPADWVRD